VTLPFENDDVYGDGVNVASRLESIADPGGIYISDSIEKAIRGQSDAQAKYLGEIQLKNVDYGVRTYGVQGVGLPIPEINGDQQLTGHIWAEIQRRGVIRAGASYVVLSLLAVLLLLYAESMVSLPHWSMTALLSILIVGFPIAMYLAWNYERSPEGLVRTISQQSWQNPYSASQKKPLTSSLVIAELIGIIISMYFSPRSQPIDLEHETSPAVGDYQVTNKSIAVLPFRNLSNDPDQEYFSDGMMEEILNHLAQIKDLQVTSRTSAMQYKNSNKSARVIVQELGHGFMKPEMEIW
jgi:hypothetical protein